MENSLLYDLLSRELSDFREELENEENECISKQLRTSREALEKSLDSAQLDILDDYKFHLVLRQELIEMQFGKRLLGLGVQIGMQLQKVFDDEQNQ